MSSFLSSSLNINDSPEKKVSYNFIKGNQLDMYLGEGGTQRILSKRKSTQFPKLCWTLQ
jgi:hypothetical protein